MKTTDLIDAVKINSITRIRKILSEQNKEAKNNLQDINAALIVAIQGGRKESAKLLINASKNLDIQDENGNVPFVMAAKKGDQELVKLFLDTTKNIDINAKNADGRTALLVAIEEGHTKIAVLLSNQKGIDLHTSLENNWTTLTAAVTKANKLMVQTLIKAGADVNAAMKDHGWTPLMAGAYYTGDIELIRMLLAAKAQVNAKMSDGRTAEFLANQKGYNQIVAILKNRESVVKNFFKAVEENSTRDLNIYLDKKDIDINFKDKNGNTALMGAAEKGHKAVAEILLKKGIDINAHGKDGKTALIVASENNHTQVAELLINQKGIDINAHGKDGKTALISAIEQHNKELINDLLKAGADVNVSTKNYGSTALMTAIEQMLEDVVETLLNTTNVNIYAEKFNQYVKGITALSLAEEKKSPNLIRVLKDKNTLIEELFTLVYNDDEKGLESYFTKEYIDVNAQNNRGEIALVVAIREANKKAIKALIKYKGINLNSKDKESISPLMAAVQENDITTFNMLLNAGANITSAAKSYDGWNLLMAAIEKPSPQIMQILLDKGEDINYTMLDGRSPLIVAIENDSKTTVKLLCEKKEININHKVKDGRTALYFAVDKDDKVILDHLLECGADINAKTNEGFSIFTYALLHNKFDMAKILIDRGFDTKYLNSDKIVLYSAVEESDVNLVQFLIQNGIIKEGRDAGFDLFGRTALNNAMDKFWKKPSADTTKIITMLHDAKIDLMPSLYIASKNQDSRFISNFFQRSESFNVNDFLIFASKQEQNMLNLKTFLETCYVRSVCGWRESNVIANAAIGYGNHDCEIVEQRGEIIKSSLHRVASGFCDEHISDNYGNRPLMWAVIGNYQDFAKESIASKYDNLGYVNKNGMTNLMWAAIFNRIEIARILLSPNIKYPHTQPHINHRDIHGKTALTYANEQGHIEIQEMLISRGAEIDITSFKDIPGVKTLLMHICEQGIISKVQEILAKGVDINATDKNGKTALILTLEKGHIDIAKVLLEQEGINTNAVMQDNWTALHAAVKIANVEMVQYFIERGADINSAMTDSFWKMLMGAVEANNLEIVQLLVDNNVDIYAKTADNKTALMIVTENDALKTEEKQKIQNILIKKANLTKDFFSNINAVDIINTTDVNVGVDGRNNIDEALRLQVNIISIQQLISSNKIGVDVKDENGNTALIFAVKQRNKVLLQFLLKYNPDVNVKDKDGNTALLIAFNQENEEIAQVLLQCNPDVNVKDKDGNTALLIAAKKGNEAMVQFLLKYNPDVNVKDKDGNTALLIAAKQQNVEIAQFLIELGFTTDVNSPNADGRLPLIISVENEDTKMVETLLAHPEIDVHSCLTNQWTDLMARGGKNSTIILKMLLDKVVDNTIEMQEHLCTVALAAMENQNLEMQEMLKSYDQFKDDEFKEDQLPVEVLGA